MEGGTSLSHKNEILFHFQQEDIKQGFFFEDSNKDEVIIDNFEGDNSLLVVEQQGRRHSSVLNFLEKMNEDE